VQDIKLHVHPPPRVSTVEINAFITSLLKYGLTWCDGNIRPTGELSHWTL